MCIRDRSCGGSPCSAHPGSSPSRRSSGRLPKRTPDIALELLDDEIMERSAAKAGLALPVAKLNRKAVRVPDLGADVVAALHGTPSEVVAPLLQVRSGLVHVIHLKRHHPIAHPVGLVLLRR